MNPEQLLNNFENVIEAPHAVPRLRRFILDLAVRGKLVEQDPNDEPAVLPRQLAQSKPSHSFTAIQEDKRRFDIPANWMLASVGELLNLQYGKAIPANDRYDHGSVPVYGSNGIVSYCETTLAQEPAIIVGRKGSAGALNLCDGPSWTTDVAYFLIPPAFFNIHYLFVTLQTLNLSSLGKGVKPGLSRAEVYQLSTVVPPLAEQHLIVAKVDELMALCDELAMQITIASNTRRQLLEATIHEALNG